MRIFEEPERALWKGICARPEAGGNEIEGRVREILSRVRDGGDAALAAISEEIDGVRPDSLEIPKEEILNAAEMVPDSLKKAINAAAANIRKFHEAQKFEEISLETIPGVRCIQRAVPIRRAGIYIPGGTAPLFSTVLMLAIPARIAGCREVIMCTPRGADGRVCPTVLYAASLCGVDRVFGIGGAQAVGAMAYGTETVPAADKIFGPGNRYVAMAKRIVSNEGVAVDMFAGPSEVLVLADSTAVPEFVAADLLSQAEHGRDSQVGLVCDSREFTDAVVSEVDRMAASLPRREIALEALRESFAVILGNRENMAEFADQYAPEHLIISTSSPWEMAGKISAAGSVFIGNFSPESAGDYASGTNHTLPTSGTATACSGVNLDSFIKKITYQELTSEGLSSLSRTIMDMARAEGLEAHSKAVSVRLGKL